MVTRPFTSRVVSFFLIYGLSISTKNVTYDRVKAIASFPFLST